MRMQCIGLLKDSPHLLGCVTTRHLTHDIFGHGGHHEIEHLLFKCAPPDEFQIDLLHGLLTMLDVDLLFWSDIGAIKVSLKF